MVPARKSDRESAETNLTGTVAPIFSGGRFRGAVLCCDVCRLGKSYECFCVALPILFYVDVRNGQRILAAVPHFRFVPKADIDTTGRLIYECALSRALCISSAQLGLWALRG